MQALKLRLSSDKKKNTLLEKEIYFISTTPFLRELKRARTKMLFPTFPILWPRFCDVLLLMDTLPALQTISSQQSGM